MAIPAAKRRKIDPNAVQINEGYDIELFLDSKDANRYLCVICQCVYQKPYNIGCDNEHIFCKGCLDDFFVPNNVRKSCPSCRYSGLLKGNMKPSRSIQRLINSLKVKCPLQSQHNVNKCIWNGDLSDLHQHINIRCPLGNMICDHCDQNIKRYQLRQHDTICTEKTIRCSLECGKGIKRGRMYRHQIEDCSMTMLSCDDCKKNVLRKHMQQHSWRYCPEFKMPCSFNKYGCRDRIKRKLMDNHLKEKETKHLQMKVNSIENQLVKVKRENKDNKAILKRVIKVLENNNIHL
eukprot:220_1